MGDEMIAVDSQGAHTYASTAALNDAGVRCVLRYGYNTTPAEVARVHGAGLSFCLIAEFDSRTWHPPLHSPETGREHAERAVAWARGLRMPQGAKITFTADTMVYPADFDRPRHYFTLAAPIVRAAGYRVDAYGGSLLIDDLHDRGLTDTTWEASATSWSSATGRATSQRHPDYRRSRTAQLRQLVLQRAYGGVTCDLNVFTTDRPAGEWMPDGTVSGRHEEDDLPSTDELRALLAPQNGWHLIVDGRGPSAWLLHIDRMVKRHLPNQPVDFPLLFATAIKEGRLPEMVDLGMRGPGDPYIGLLDLADLTGPAPA